MLIHEANQESNQLLNEDAVQNSVKTIAAVPPKKKLDSWYTKGYFSFTYWARFLCIIFLLEIVNYVFGSIWKGSELMLV